MKKEERQKLIFDLIESESRLQLKDFFEKSDIFEKRTLIRDLNELIEKNLISKKNDWKNTFYSISTSYRLNKEYDVNQYFSIEYLQRDIIESFNFWVFELLKNDLFSEQEKEYLAQLQAKFIENISKYDSQTLINKEYERIMIEFSRKSSSIEWNTYSLLSTEALLKNNIKDLAKTPEETQMILNHKDAFNEVIQNRDSFITLSLQSIEYIHSVLTKKIWITKNIRKNPVRIAWTKYKPLDNEFQIEEAMQDFIKLINNKKSFFEKSFLALLLTSYIQPFEDGNKRTARTLSNAILLANNSIPLSYRVIDNVEYMKATILFYEQNNISYFKKLYITQVEDAVNNFFC